MTATITLSVEVELAWGFHDLPHGGEELLSDDRRAETEALERLLAHCDDAAVPISFDVVGHLLEASCDGSHDGPHEPGWFDADPGTSVDADPLFYAPDLVRTIDEARIAHELCTHTYSHVELDAVDADVVEWELEAVRNAWSAFDLSPPTSIVPPRHATGALDVLRDHEIEVVRRALPELNLEGEPPVKFLRLLRQTVPERPPRTEAGLTHVYATPYPSLTSLALPNGQRSAPRSVRVIPRRVRRRLHERWLRRQTEAAVERDGHLHLWTHLCNAANEPQLRAIGNYLEYLGERQAAGDLTVVPMRSLAGATDHDHEHEARRRRSA